MDKIQNIWIEKKYWTNHWLEKQLRAIVWRLPKRLIMWAFYRVLSHATTGKYSKDNVVGMTWETAIDRWMKDNRL